MSYDEVNWEDQESFKANQRLNAIIESMMRDKERKDHAKRQAEIERAEAERHRTMLKNTQAREQMGLDVDLSHYDEEAKHKRETQLRMQQALAEQEARDHEKV